MNQLCASNIACEKCFYICDICGSCITFLIHKEQFAFQVHALKTTIKLDFRGTSDEFLSCEMWFFSCIAS